MTSEELVTIVGCEDAGLFARTDDLVGDSRVLPKVDERMVSCLVEPDDRIPEVLADWSKDAPEVMAALGLGLRQRMKLQRRRLYLRNRRIVCGYELLDRELRHVLGNETTDGVPPTWLSIGKWTAKTIGDLLNEQLYLPSRHRKPRMAVRRLLRLLRTWRTVPMGRIFVLGNREIFAQVAGTLAAFVNVSARFKSGPADLTFENFIGTYALDLVGRGRDPRLPDEILFPIRSTARDPLSDSMLRALYAYYRAIGASPQDRCRWVMAGNLYIAAYEQLVAQPYIDVGMSASPTRRLRKLLDGNGQPAGAAVTTRPTKASGETLTEQAFALRLIDFATAAFSTRFVLSLGVGRKTTAPPPRDPDPALVFAPGYPLRGLSEKSTPAFEPTTDASLELERVWNALDRAHGHSKLCRVRDWRSYAARINYITNLFAVAVGDSRFLDPVFDDEEMLCFLSGRLPAADNVTISDHQRAIAERVLGPQMHTLMSTAT